MFGFAGGDDVIAVFVKQGRCLNESVPRVLGSKVHNAEICNTSDSGDKKGGEKNALSLLNFSRKLLHLPLHEWLGARWDPHVATLIRRPKN
jgi:hypothetical protein